jgi:hypothetical protein
MTPAQKSRIIEILGTPPSEGGYRKGSGRLFRRRKRNGEVQDTFCCLGVMTDICVQEGILTWEESVAPAGNYGDDAEPVEKLSYAPQVVLDYWGIGYWQGRALAEVNDDSKSFKPVIERIKTL